LREKGEGKMTIEEANKLKREMRITLLMNITITTIIIITKGT
jgi:hypothetical protein